MNNNIAYKIKPAGRHIFTIGRDLIQDNYAAVIELVKNAYDADSHNVNIEFRAFPEYSGYCIIIFDDGRGMSRNDVINKWMVPSTEDKLERRESPSGRILQGNKGVGRYASSILGRDMFLETVTHEGEKTTAYLEWKDFEKAQYLDDVEILIETTKVSKSRGTRLTMKGDKDFLANWKQEHFDKLKFELRKLKSPMSPAFSMEVNDDPFRINLTIKGFHNVEDIEETIEPYPLLDLFDYKITGKISKDGKGTLTYSSQKARNIPEEKIPFNLGKSTGCGELYIDIRVYDLEAEAVDALIKRGFKDQSDKYVEKSEAREILRANNGIGVYRNGFRIRPLGDADFDWLELNRRRVNTPTRCIGSNQAIGYVQIQSDKQSGLIEKSARDGLKENEPFNQLKEVTRKVITELEWRRFEYRMKAGLSRPASKVESDLQGLFSFDELKQSVRTRLNKNAINQTTTDEIIELIDQDAENKNKVVEEIRQVVAIYQGQATLGKIINVILHEGRHPLNYFKNRISYLRRRYKLFQKNKDSVDFEKIMQIVNGFAENSEFLVSLFSKLDPLAAGRRSRKKSFELKKTIKNALSVFESKMKANNISVEIIGPDDFKFSGWSQDIHAIFTNLIDNSLYWICETNIPVRRITIQLKMDGNALDYIDYSDTGPGIEPSLIESEIIFEPHFSTKPDGTGLGLAIAGEAAERNGLQLKAVVSEEGAHFTLQPKTESGK